MEMTPKLKQAVKEYKAGNAESFECLYKESEKYIYTCIYKIMSGNNNALDITEEVMQETYLEICLSISQLENEDRFLSWAGTIATRKCFAYIKKNKKYVLLNEDDDTFENLSDSDDIIPEEVMQSREKQRLVREIIDTQLTEIQKICVYDYYYNQMKQSEIAELYGMPLNTVKTNLSRAKVKIEEGVVYLEKKKGTKLYSFAPLFVLLYNEDVMAAEVPAEIGASVLSGVAEASAKAVGATTASSATASVEGAGAATTASTAGTTTSIALKVGVLGKIAAASTKAKILMAVATVSVVGTVGGGVMVASQNGLFGNAPTVNENQEISDYQESDENQALENVQGTEAVLETEVEETETTEVTEKTNEAVIDESAYTEFDEAVHFRVAYLPDELANGEDRGNANFFGRRYVKEYEDGTWDVFYLRAWPEGDIESSRLNLKNMSDEQIGTFTGGTADFSTLQKIVTEEAYIVFIEYDCIIDMEEYRGYDLYINDYTTGKAYSIAVNRTVEYYDSAQMLSILKSIEILE